MQYKPNRSKAAPPTLRDLIPHSYLLRVTPVSCTRCKARHHTVETFLVRICPGLTEQTGFRQLTPCESMPMPLPVGMTTLVPRVIAFCHECIATIPEVEAPKQTTEQSWNEALRADARAHAKQKPAQPREMSADDIDF